MKPPCTERYARWCERTGAYHPLLLDWTDLGLLHSTGTNPDSKRSIVLYAETVREKQYGYEPYVLISQVLTRELPEEGCGCSALPFSDEDLFPISRIRYLDPDGCGGYGPVAVDLKDGSRKVVDYEGIEGRLTL